MIKESKKESTIMFKYLHSLKTQTVFTNQPNKKLAKHKSAKHKLAKIKSAKHKLAKIKSAKINLAKHKYISPKQCSL